MAIIKSIESTVLESNIEGFIERWQGQDDGTERVNYQLFLTELCDLLVLPKPDPAASDTEQNSYVFERRVDIKHPNEKLISGIRYLNQIA